MLSKDLVETARHHLYTAVISDVLDGLGNLHHAMAPAIRPLDDTLVLFGRARTGLVPVECGGAMVRPNDWIFGDVDGVVVIPGSLVEKVLDLAIEKVTAENTVRQELEAGESLATVFARHKIL